MIDAGPSAVTMPRKSTFNVYHNATAVLAVATSDAKSVGSHALGVWSAVQCFAVNGNAQLVISPIQVKRSYFT